MHRRGRSRSGEGEPLRHRAGDAELAVPHRLLHHRARIAGRLLRADERRGEVVAQHVVLPLHIGAFPACTAAVIDAFGDGIADRRRLHHQPSLPGRQPARARHRVITPVFVDGALFGFCGSIAHKSDIGGPVPGSCSGQAREIFNEGLHLPAVRYQSGYGRNRRHRAPHRRQQPHARTGARRHPRPARRRPAGREAAQRAGRQIRPREDPRLLRPAARDVGSQGQGGRRRMGGRALRGRALRRRRRHRPGTAGAHPRRRREERRPRCISISAARPTRPRDPPISARRWCRRPAPMR